VVRTGDEYMQDADGFFHHRGRSGDMLRVSSIVGIAVEIEDALAGILSIAETAAVLGEQRGRLAEICSLSCPRQDDGRVAVEDARQRLARVLPDYKLPRRFEIIASCRARPRARSSVTSFAMNDLAGSRLIKRDPFHSSRRVCRIATFVAMSGCGLIVQDIQTG